MPDALPLKYIRPGKMLHEVTNLAFMDEAQAAFKAGRAGNAY